MDISIFYQLRERLSVTAVAGCSTINEDFRLKKAVESFGEIAGANKVFSRLNNMCLELLSSENPAPLLADCIALCDALAVTQATFRHNGETMPKKGFIGCVPSDIKYSELSVGTIIGVLSNLTGKDSEQAATDPRIINRFLSNLGDAFHYCPELCEKYTMSIGRGIVPFFKERFADSDKTEAAAIVRAVGILARETENDWYLEIIDDPKNPARAEAVRCLGFDKANAEKLLELYRTEKGKVKDAALACLVRFDTPETEEALKKITAKFAKKNVTLIAMSRNPIAVTFALDFARETFFGAKPDTKNFAEAISMLANKPEAEEIFRGLAEMKNLGEREAVLNTCEAILMQNIVENRGEEFRTMIENLSRETGCFARALFFMMMTEDGRGKPTDYPEIIDGARYEIINMFRYVPYDESQKKYAIFPAFFHYPTDCIANVGSYVSSEKLLELVDFIADGSYFERLDRKKYKKKRTYYYDDTQIPEYEYNIKCLKDATDVIHDICARSAEQDKETIKEKVIDFCRRAFEVYPTASDLDWLLTFDADFIRKSEKRFSDCIIEIMKNAKYVNDIVSAYILKKCPDELKPELDVLIQRLETEKIKGCTATIVNAQLREVKSVRS